MNILIKKISKYFSFILRHQPEAIGLQLDAQGWASIDQLIAKTADYKLNRELIELVVETNDKQRFCISEDGTKIRANQGHSIEIDFDLNPQTPPAILLHGTATRFLDSIMKDGLQKMQRHHVHLSENEGVSRAVGSRYGKPVILKINTAEMLKKGFKFYKTTNNVWLVDNVPAEFLDY